MQEHTEMWNEGTNIWKIQCLQPNQTTMPSSVKSFLIFTASYVDQLCSCIGKLYTNYITLPTYNLIYSEWGQRNAYCTQFTTNLQSQLPQIMLAHTHIVWKDTWRPFTNSLLVTLTDIIAAKHQYHCHNQANKRQGFPLESQIRWCFTAFMYFHRIISVGHLRPLHECAGSVLSGACLWQTSFEYASL